MEVPESLAAMAEAAESSRTGLGFNPSADVEALISNTGLFKWSPDIISKLEKCNMPGARDIKWKKLHMVAYLCEFAYDLCLSSELNVSKSPGFETVLGVFGGSL